MQVRKYKLTHALLGLLAISIPLVTFAEETSKGAILWTDNCARCHNPRPPSEFNSENWQTIMQHMRIRGGLTGEEAREVLAFIVPGFAPSSASTTAPANAETEHNVSAATSGQTTTSTEKAKSTAKAAEKKLLVASNSTQNKAQATENKTPKRSGKEIFQQTCVACHGANGKGAIPGVPDFSKSGGPLSQSNAVLMKHIKEGFQKPGDPMAMPPKGGNPNLSDEDIKQVLEYIETTFKH